MTITATAIILLGAIGAALFFKKRKKDKSAGKKNNPDTLPSREKSDPDKNFRDILDSLLNLNIMLRKDTDLSKDMKKSIEATIDDLVTVIPAMMERYPSEALTYEIKKIGRTHLHKIVKEYLDLSAESRQNQFEIFRQTVENLNTVSKRARTIVENNETAEFKTMANFLAGKF